jgi:hypothetical protein
MSVQIPLVFLSLIDATSINFPIINSIDLGKSPFVTKFVPQIINESEKTQKHHHRQLLLHDSGVMTTFVPQIMSHMLPIIARDEKCNLSVEKKCLV